MVTKLEEARSKELDPAEVALLWRFTQAYRPHDTPPTWQELKANGLTKMDEDSLLDIIIDQYEGAK